MTIRYPSIHLPLMCFVLCMAAAHPILKVFGIGMLLLSRHLWQWRINQLGLFYVWMLLFGTASAAIHFILNPQANYLILITISTFFWGLCLVGHNVFLSTARNLSPSTQTQTIRYTFYILLAISIVQYTLNLIQRGHLLPTGFYGDYMKSIFTFSSDCMLVYALYFYFFIQKKHYKRAVLAFFGLLITNYMAGFLLFIISFAAYVFVFRRPRIRYYLYTVAGIVLVFAALRIFYWDNISYMAANVRTIYTALSSQKTLTLSRKVVSYKQTLDYVCESPKTFLFGAGPANFSSRVAFMGAGEYVDWYPKQLTYQHPIFVANHFSLWNKKILSQPFSDGATQQPFSFYSQIIGEYGLFGLAAFLILYLGFLWKIRKKLKPEYKAMGLLFLMGLMLDYWFDYFSIAFFFEWLLFYALYAKEKTQTIIQSRTIP